MALDTWSHVAPQPWTRGVTWRLMCRPAHTFRRTPAGRLAPLPPCRPTQRPPPEAHLLRPPCTARSAPPLPSPCVSGAPADRSSPPLSPLPVHRQSTCCSQRTPASAPPRSSLPGSNGKQPARRSGVPFSPSRKNRVTAFTVTAMELYVLLTKRLALQRTAHNGYFVTVLTQNGCLR